jgi:formate dehydrogenase gamma subunit
MRGSLPIFASAAVALLFFFSREASVSAAPIKDSACLDCHADQDLYKTNAAGKAISLYADVDKLKASVHRTNSCASCHSDLTADHPDDGVAAKRVDCGSCHERQSVAYGTSVHGLALSQGKENVATCRDCHGNHSVLPPASVDSPLSFAHLAQTCGNCHPQAAKDVGESVHGKAVRAGHRDAPTCTDCHAEHNIQDPKNRGAGSRSADVCSTCHASERMNTRYNLPNDRVSTFLGSYHGLATQYGSPTAANCGSCHGHHKVLPSSDPGSTIHRTNLRNTCGNCHPGASENFVESKVHVDADGEVAATDFAGNLNWWVRRVYLVLIFGTIGFMATHNGLLFFRKMRARYRGANLKVERMNRSQRMQHAILALSFIILAITGFALKFPDSWVSKLMGSSEELRRWSHRGAGVILLLGGLYHVYYILKRPEGRKLLQDLWPAKKDGLDLIENARFLSGISESKAKFGRFGYAEKMEYWAVVWGTFLMGLTGLMIWFKMEVTQFLPRWTVDVATTIHYYEALLACLAIVVWHFYHVIFDPDVYPINWACLNGKVSQHWQEEEHPLEKIESEQVTQPRSKPAPETKATKL